MLVMLHAPDSSAAGKRSAVLGRNLRQPVKVVESAMQVASLRKGFTFVAKIGVRRGSGIENLYAFLPDGSKKFGAFNFL
jgi:hypothetical protein